MRVWVVAQLFYTVRSSNNITLDIFITLYSVTHLIKGHVIKPLYYKSANLHLLCLQGYIILM